MTDLVLTGTNGGTIKATSHSNREMPDYLFWSVNQYEFAVVDNTPATRRFLEDLLQRFRKDATRLRAKERNQEMRKLGVRAALAGKSIDSFYELDPPKRGYKKGRLTESMRGEFEIGYRSVKVRPTTIGEENK